jgi:putative acetyltransferase
VEIRVDDLRGAQIIRLLEEHLRGMYEVTPHESVHALDLSGLRRPEVTMWSAWEGGELLGCGALKALDAQHGEVKSMRTARPQLRRGVATAILLEIIAESRRRGYRRVSLETGSMAAFEPARALYARFGFQPCGPFADYSDDPNSYYMTLELGRAA